MTEIGKRLLKRFLAEPEVFARQFGFEDLGRVHGSWIKKTILEPMKWSNRVGRVTEGGAFGIPKKLVMAHRESYKTTSMMCGVALLLLWKPHLQVLVLHASFKIALRRVKELSALLKSDKWLEISDAVYGVPLLKETKDSEIKIIIPKGYKTEEGRVPIDNEYNVISGGLTTAITGLHCDLVILDDLVDDKNTSEVIRLTTLDRYREMLSVVKRDGAVVIVGTPHHQYDLYHHLRTSGQIKEEDMQFYPVTKSMIDVCRTEEWQTHKRKEVGERVFSQQYLLTTFVGEDMPFANLDEKIKRDKFTVDERVTGTIWHLDKAYGGGDHTVLTRVQVVSNYVGSYSGSKTWGGITYHPAMKPPKSYYFLVTGWSWNRHIDACSNAIQKLVGESRLYTETNDDKGMWSAQARRLYELEISTYHEQEGPAVKAQSYIIPRWNRDQIFFTEDMDTKRDITEAGDGHPHWVARKNWVDRLRAWDITVAEKSLRKNLNDDSVDSLGAALRIAVKRFDLALTDATMHRQLDSLQEDRDLQQISEFFAERNKRVGKMIFGR